MQERWERIFPSVEHFGYYLEWILFQGWDDLYDFDTCCLGVSKTLQSFKSVFGPLLRVLCCGCTLAPLILLGWGLGNIQTLSRIWTTQTYTLYGFRAIYPRGEMGSWTHRGIFYPFLGLGLSVVGFCLYLQRQLREAWGNAGRRWLIWCESFGKRM